MIEKILVPLDGSKIGEAALPHVKELVDKLSPETKAEVILFQVISPLSHYVVGGEATIQVPYTAEELEQTKKKAKDYLDRIGKGLKGKGLTVRSRVEIGNAAEEIIRVADDLNADLIAMSTHGRSGINRWAFGSVTDRVLRGGTKPVLTVRAPKGGQPIQL